MILFLDFDGVLRRKHAPLYRLEEHLVYRLVTLLREFSEVKIVITSTWTDAFSLNETKQNFPDDIADRIIGKTSHFSTPVEHQRYREIKRYLEKQGGDPAWVTLDDTHEYFLPGIPLVLVDSSTGFSKTDASDLRKYFETAEGPSG